MRSSPRFRALFPLLALALLFGSSPAAEVRVTGRTFTLDGRPFDMWGIRVASASQSQELTDHLVAQLDEYLAHGVNSISVYYMGSSSGYSDPFSPDGKSIDPAHQQRMEQIIRACDQRGMVPVIGIFYQRSDQPQLRDWAAAQEAVRTVTRALQPFRNVILNIANEQNSYRYARMRWGRVQNPDDLLELCRIAKRIDPHRVVGAGGYDPTKNQIIGQSPATDVLLFDTDRSLTTERAYERFLQAGIDKPMVNVETFGGWTNQFLPAGAFPDSVKRAYYNEVAAASRHEGLYLHFHNTPWCQPFVPDERTHYELGAGPRERNGRMVPSGTVHTRGIRWYFEYVRERRKNPLPAPLSPEQRAQAIHEERDGIIVLEAEDLARSAVWEFAATPHGYFGRGWVRYIGPRRGEGQKDGHNSDPGGKYQGPPEDQLVARIKINTPGEYVVRGHVYHTNPDGDNDAWVNLTATPNGARRWGDSRAAQGRFGWNDFNCWTDADHPCRGEGLRFTLDAGVHEIYWAGRSQGFGIDRVVLHRADRAEAALALTAAPTPPQPSALVSVPRSTYAVLAVRDFTLEVSEFAPFYRDLLKPDPAKHALAIDATVHRGAFAAAQTKFAGPAGDYDLTLATLTENDGESTYRLRIAGRIIGEFKNPARAEDATTFQHTWHRVRLEPGVVIQIESNTHSNGRIPEGNAFGWSRGRWTKLTAVPADSDQAASGTRR